MKPLAPSNDDIPRDEMTLARVLAEAYNRDATHEAIAALTTALEEGWEE